MKENVLKSFIRDTYKTSSLIPYFITGQALMFVIIHILELVSISDITNSELYIQSISTLSLPKNWTAFLFQPWSLITHPFVYEGIFNLVFDCLWLYWMGNMFLTFLNNRQFSTLFIGSLLLGGIFYLGLGSLNLIPTSAAYFHTTRFGLAALISSMTILIPNLEVRLFLFGNVKLKIIAIVYLSLEFGFLVIQDKIAAIVYAITALVGVIFMHQLQKGKDLSKLFERKKTKLKVLKNDIGNSKSTYKRHKSDLPNQEIIDEILDKISLKGYESLTSQEKDILFKASKEDN